MRAYAHITEVFVFLLSQVSQSLYKHLYISDLSGIQRYFNELSRLSSPKRSTTSKNTDFRADLFLVFPSFFQHFLSLFSLFSPKCDTCDSKKTKLRLECARLRVYAINAHQKISLHCFSYFPFFPLLLFPSSSFFPACFFLLLFSFLLPSLPLAFPSSLLGARDSIL